VALVAAWGLLAADRMPASIALSAHAAAGIGVPRSSPDDLSTLRVFNRVTLLLKDNYVDPKRVDPRKMLVSALDGVERQVAEVLVEGDEKSPTITLTVNKASKTFDVSKVDNLWNMSFALKSMFGFLDQHLVREGKDEARDIEYAAINGMLATLDPHSIMLKSEYFKEMRLQSKGEFGGVGFVIQMKESNLTVVRVMKGTPAQKAGIRAKDVVTRINGESTVNIDLNEAVSRLRGKPGTPITITVKRDGWKAPRDMTLERALINVESVQGKMLEDDVGYIRLKGFQSNTARDLATQLAALRAKAGKAGLKGLVLDLRGNPGGLLDQAILISDMFLDKGTIVTTVGYSDKLREVKRAQPSGPESNLPIVVLVNPASASASEIVAGALKNNDRAMVVGRSTFGKGSVQVLYDNFPDDGALKLTIAQYLTPGDRSIQEVGITPDIELIPSRIDAERVDFFAPKRQMGEADLEQHFGNPDSTSVAKKREEVVRTEQPLETFLYLRESTPPKGQDDGKGKPKKKDVKVGKKNPKKEKDQPKAQTDSGDESDIDLADMAEYEGLDPNTDEIVEDFPIRFARKLLSAAPVASRSEMLSKTQALRERLRAEEARRVEAAIGKLGVDWSTQTLESIPSQASASASASASSSVQATTAAQAPKLDVQLTPSGPIRVGETISWTLTVTNQSPYPLARLRAYSDSDNPWFDRREFIFGRLEPGQTKSWTSKIKLRKEIVSRREPVTLRFQADGFDADAIPSFASEVNLVELERPSFAFGWQVLDTCAQCNGDGVPQIGETVTLDIVVKNVGDGTSFDTLANLKNKDVEEGLSLIKGRVKMGPIEPGESKRARFEFELTPAFAKEEAVLQLILGDESTSEWIIEKLKLQVGPKPVVTAQQGAAARTIRETSLYAAALDGAPALGALAADVVLAADARLGDFWRVRFDDGDTGGTGFVRVSDVTISGAGAPAKAQWPAVQRVPLRHEPRIELSGIDLQQGGLSTNEAMMSLSGSATNAGDLRDLYVFVNDQKVFFKAAEEDSKRIDFQATLPLKEGKNTVYIVARENKDVQSYKMIVVTRVAP
jgi:carboxyl-terminal processing protease